MGAAVSRKQKHVEEVANAFSAVEVLQNSYHRPLMTPVRKRLPPTPADQYFHSAPVLTGGSGKSSSPKSDGWKLSTEGTDLGSSPIADIAASGTSGNVEAAPMSPRPKDRRGSYHNTAPGCSSVSGLDSVRLDTGNGSNSSISDGRPLDKNLLQYALSRAAHQPGSQAGSGHVPITGATGMTGRPRVGGRHGLGGGGGPTGALLHPSGGSPPAYRAPPAPGPGRHSTPNVGPFDVVGFEKEDTGIGTQFSGLSLSGAAAPAPPASVSVSVSGGAD